MHGHGGINSPCDVHLFARYNLFVLTRGADNLESRGPQPQRGPERQRMFCQFQRAFLLLLFWTLDTASGAFQVFLGPLEFVLRRYSFLGASL